MLLRAEMLAFPLALRNLPVAAILPRSMVIYRLHRNGALL